MFRKAGTIRVKAMAWDENPERPGQSTMVIEIAQPDRTSIEQVGAALIGDEANPIAQMGLLVATIFILAMLTRRKKGKSVDDPWQHNGLEGEDLSDQGLESPSLVDQAQARRPKAPPSDLMFVTSFETDASVIEPEDVSEPISPPQEPVTETEGPPLPAGGLPEGWTEEQWSHYGHQYIEAQSSHP